MVRAQMDRYVEFIEEKGWDFWSAQHENWREAGAALGCFGLYFWEKDAKAQTPVASLLHPLAKMLLGMPAASVASERVVSAGGLLDTDPTQSPDTKCVFGLALYREARPGARWRGRVHENAREV